MILFIDGQGIFFNKELSFQIKENSFSSTQSKPNNEINLIKFVTIYLIKRKFIIHNLLWIEKIYSKRSQMICICKRCVNWSIWSFSCSCTEVGYLLWFALTKIMKLWIRIYCPTFNISIWILISTISHVWFVSILNFNYFIRKKGYVANYNW